MRSLRSSTSLRSFELMYSSICNLRSMSSSENWVLSDSLSGSAMEGMPFISNTDGDPHFPSRRGRAQVLQAMRSQFQLSAIIIIAFIFISLTCRVQPRFTTSSNPSPFIDDGVLNGQSEHGAGSQASAFSKMPGHLRLSGLTDWPSLHITVHPRTNRSLYSGVLLEMVKVLSRGLNFTYSWVSNNATDSRFGGLDTATGKPYGLFSLLDENQTDLLVAEALLTSGRAAIADYTYPYYVAGVYLVTRKPSEVPPWKKFVYIYDMPTWLCLVFTSGLIVAVLANASSSSSSNHSTTYSVAGSGAMLMARLLSDQPTMVSRLPQTKTYSALRRNLMAWIIMVIGLLCVVITSSGKGTILSTLLTVRYEKPISTPDDFRNSGLELYLRNGTAYSDIAKILNLKFLVLSGSRDARCEMIMKNPEKYGSLFGTRELLAQIIEDKNCDGKQLWAHSDGIATTPVSLYLRRGLVEVAQFDRLIQRAVETGLFSKWDSDALLRQWNQTEVAEQITKDVIFSSGKALSRAEPVTLKFKHIQGPVVFLCGGCGLACLVFFGELIMEKSNRRMSR